MITSLQAYYWIGLILSITVAWHALLYKRSPKAAAGWIAFILLLPYFGAILYFLLGINRIQTRAKKLHTPNSFDIACAQGDKGTTYKQLPSHLSALSILSETLSRNKLTSDNSIEILHNGDSAYPEMLKEIASARSYIYLSTYIFDTDDLSLKFIAALKAAKDRGVNVLVLIDGIGELGNIPRASTLLRKQGITVARYLPPRLIPPSIYLNLRNHRKALIIDGNITFVGGMNISQRHLVAENSIKKAVIDMQLKFTGLIAKQIEAIFLEDWMYATGDKVEFDASDVCRNNPVLCRAISDGPNEEIDNLLQIITKAISSAKTSIKIMTPYFIPPQTLIDVLNIAALSGIQVDIVLPEKSDARIADWAARKNFWQLLQRGVNIYYQPAPFSHSKLLIIDNSYSLIGSANFDARSLRLNFELGIELYDIKISKALAQHFKDVQAASRPTNLAEIDQRSLAIRSRDALAWLLSPYI